MCIVSQIGINTSTHPEQRFNGLWVQQAHDAMVPGETSTHHKDAHSTDERGDVAHVGEAIPKDERY